jgi:hypothetical protein
MLTHDFGHHSDQITSKARNLVLATRQARASIVALKADTAQGLPGIGSPSHDIVNARKTIHLLNLALLDLRELINDANNFLEWQKTNISCYTTLFGESSPVVDGD